MKPSAGGNREPRSAKERSSRPEIQIQSLILPVYLPTVLVMLGLSMVLPVLPLLARSLGAGLAITGVIVSMRGVGALLFDLPAGAMISRVGKLPALLFAAAAGIMIAFATGLVNRLFPLALLTIAMGAVHVLWILSIQTHIRQNLPDFRRGRAMSLVGGSLRIGAIAGPIIGGYIGKAFGLQAAYFGQAVCFFCTLVVLVMGISHYRWRTVERRGRSFRSSGIPFLRTLEGRWRDVVTVGLVVISLTIVRTGRQTLLPLWGERIALDVAAIGLIFGLSRASELLMTYPAGALMDRKGRKWAMVPCLLLLSLGLALIPTARGFTGLLLVSMIAGIGNGLGSGIVMTLGADLSPRKSTGEFLGIWHMVTDIGAVSGPLLIGVAAQALGLFVAPIAVALFGLFGAWMMIFRVSETLDKKKI